MTDPTTLTLDDWIAALDRSDAEVAAGQSVPLEPIIRDLIDTASRLEADVANSPRRGARHS